MGENGGRVNKSRRSRKTSEKFIGVVKQKFVPIRLFSSYCFH